MSRRYNSKNRFGDLGPLSNKMQSKLPGAALEMGYAISGPDGAGYYGIRGPGLTTAAFVSGDIPYYLPQTNQLIYKPYTAPPIPKLKPKPMAKSKDGFPIIGWVAIAVIAFVIISN